MWWKRMRWVAISSPRPADVLKKLPALATKTAAELSLAAVKSFRDDAVAAGLRLAVPASHAAE